MTDINSSLVAINSSLQHYDPCWLPSAIMQTTGAIIGIFSVIFIFSFPRFEDMLKVFIQDKRNMSISITLRSTVYLLVLLVMLFGCFTIYSSMLWLKGLTTSSSIITSFGQPIDLMTEMLFTALLVILVGFSFLLIVIEYVVMKYQ
jgi:hypothetical protein